MDFETYQDEAMNTKRVIPGVPDLAYTALALAGEVGELCNKVKKMYRGEKFYATVLAEDREREQLYYDGMKLEIMDELGDVLWYTASLADALGVQLRTIAEDNLDKLQARYENYSERESNP